MKIISTIVPFLVSAVLISGCAKKTGGPAPVLVVPPTPIVDKNWQFEATPMWEDNFDIDGAPDLGKWTLETGGGGWGNNELQYYTDNSNATVSNGILAITAKKEAIAGNNYTSARMMTKNKGDFLYGRIEVKAKLPKGKGTWPAIWMLYSNSLYGVWPASGEIDLMEHVGHDPNRVHFTVHTSSYNHLLGTQKSANMMVAGANDAFHLYRVDWTPYAIRGYIDNVLYFTFVNANTGFPTWPFDKSFFLIMNVAVGGSWGGSQGVDDSAFPATMLVDHVKVYKMIP